VEILINRDVVGTGRWEGQLGKGFYAVTTRADGIESNPLYFWVEDESQVQLDLSAPMADYGYLNIYSNEIDADIYLDGKLIGQTPSMSGKLLAGKKYSIRLSKHGFHDAQKMVEVIGNTLTDVNIKMKRNKRIYYYEKGS